MYGEWSQELKERDRAVTTSQILQKRNDNSKETNLRCMKKDCLYLTYSDMFTEELAIININKTRRS